MRENLIIYRLIYSFGPSRSAILVLVAEREAILSLRALEVTVIMLTLMRSPFMAWFALLQRTIRETRGSSQLSDWLSRILQPNTLTEREKERETFSIRWTSSEAGRKRFCVPVQHRNFAAHGLLTWPCTFP